MWKTEQHESNIICSGVRFEWPYNCVIGYIVFEFQTAFLSKPTETKLTVQFRLVLYLRYQSKLFMTKHTIIGFDIFDVEKKLPQLIFQLLQEKMMLWSSRSTQLRVYEILQ